MKQLKLATWEAATTPGIGQNMEEVVLLSPGSGAIRWKTESWRGPWSPSGAGTTEGGTVQRAPEPRRRRTRTGDATRNEVGGQTLASPFLSTHF